MTKEKTLLTFVQDMQKEGPTNVLVMTLDAKDNVLSTLVGDPNKIGQAILNIIYNNKNPKLGTQIYEMIRNIVYSIITANDPKLSEDMQNMVIAALAKYMEQQEGEEGEAKPSQPKIIPMYGDKKD